MMSALDIIMTRGGVNLYSLTNCRPYAHSLFFLSKVEIGVKNYMRQEK
jgi:hypothetical protein